MSYILDALKRSERSRQRHRPLVYRSASPSARVVPAALVAVFVAVLLVGTLAAVYWWQQSSTAPEGEAPLVEVTASSAPVTTDGTNKTAGVAGTARKHVPAASGSRPLAATAAVARSTAPPPREEEAGPVPLLSAMPAEFQDRLPPMEVNIHVYSPDPAQRILYINNRAYRQGDEVTGGAVVEEVVPDGVVLYYEAKRFRLSRPR